GLPRKARRLPLPRLHAAHQASYPPPPQSRQEEPPRPPEHPSREEAASSQPSRHPLQDICKAPSRECIYAPLGASVEKSCEYFTRSEERRVGKERRSQRAQSRERERTTGRPSGTRISRDV